MTDNGTLEHLVERDRRPGCGTQGGRPRVRVVAVAELPTRYGGFRVVGFCTGRDDKEHLAIVRGEIVGRHDVLTRIHSECLTGDALGSLRCDCRDQLEAALRTLARQPRGLLLYLRQEGRGIGLTNKIRAYSLQDQGLDTVEANLALGFHDDERRYDIAAAMLRGLDVRSIRLMTNNPRKLDQLRSLGIEVTGREPLVIPPNEHNRFYLETKARRSGHFIELESSPEAPATPSPWPHAAGTTRPAPAGSLGGSLRAKKA